MGHKSEIGSLCNEEATETRSSGRVREQERV